MFILKNEGVVMLGEFNCSLFIRSHVHIWRCCDFSNYKGITNTEKEQQILTYIFFGCLATLKRKGNATWAGMRRAQRDVLGIRPARTWRKWLVSRGIFSPPNSGKISDCSTMLGRARVAIVCSPAMYGVVSASSCIYHS